MGRGERANLTIQGQLRAFREAVSMRYTTEIGPDHVLMGWMVRHCACVVNNFQVKSTKRTPYRSIRRKDYTGEVVPFGEICLGRNHSEDGAKVYKGDAIKIEASEEIVEEPDANLKKRKIGEPDINPGGASSLTTNTPKKRESEQKSSANESSLAGCIAAVNNHLCDTPTVDRSRDRTALSGKFPEDELKAGRELEFRNMLNFDASDLVGEFPAKHACDMVWVDEWRGDRVSSRLCVRQFKAEVLRDDLFAGTPDTFFIKYLVAKAASCKDFGLLVVIDISVAFMHARTDEEIYVKVPSGIKSSRFWRLKAAVNGTRKASKHRQEYSSDKLVTNMLFQKNDINPCIYKRFCDNLDLEQHGDDFLVCGATQGLEELAKEFNGHFLVKNSEIASLKPEHQGETHFLKRLISVDEFGWHVELDQRYVKVCWMQWR